MSADRETLKKLASDRAARIRKFREQTLARRPRVLATRTIIEDGRIATVHRIDASAELGRGACYWLAPIYTSTPRVKTEAA